MKILRPTVTYTSASLNPIVSREYVLTEREQEVLDLRNLIMAESSGSLDATTAPLHALSVLLGHEVDPVFVEWLTSSMFTTPGGDRWWFVGTQPAYANLLARLEGWWQDWLV